MFHIVSFRSPYQVSWPGRAITDRADLGGVVFTLDWFLSRHGGRWISATGTTEPTACRAYDVIRHAPADRPFTLDLVTLPKDDIRRFYSGFCNRSLWPLFHGTTDKCTFDDEEWKCYLRINNLFANLLKSQCKKDSTIWVHDYHFAMIGSYFRSNNCTIPISLFWHIPFPGVQVTCRLPWIKALLRGLLAYDLIGFHTRRYASNFLDAVEFFLDAEVDREKLAVRMEGRRISLVAEPVGIDYDAFQDQTAIEDKGSKSNSDSVFTFLGVDRNDYTKGIIEKLHAFEFLLAQHPGLRRKVRLVQIAAPSRTEVPEYQTLDARIRNLATEINQRYAVSGWVPVEIVNESLDRMSLVRHYRSADALIVSSLADGLNLVSLEFVASRNDEQGALLLTRCAGAAAYLGPDALLLDPHNKQDIAEQMKRAVEMDDDEQRIRMRRLRSVARRFSVQRWSNAVLGPLLHHSHGPRPDATSETADADAGSRFPI